MQPATQASSPISKKRFAKTKLSLGPVAENEYQAFAMKHALAIYDSKSLYTYVPKNACSTMRYSIARNNRFIDAHTDVDWHHSNNLTFCASQEFAANAEYAFVVLRCPFRRIASAYLDKVVTANRVVRSIYPIKIKKIQLRLMERSMYHGLTFRTFIERISRIRRQELNQHWRPQADFMLYDSYDDYFSVEDFGRVATVLNNQIGFTVYDTRNIVGHDTQKFEKVSGHFTDTLAGELFVMRNAGQVPDYASLYDDDLRKVVAGIYADDIELYAQTCDPGNLLFPDAAVGKLEVL